MSKQDVSTSLL